jgi:hypothetical protein
MSANSVIYEMKGASPPEGWSAKPSMWGSSQQGKHTPSVSEIAFSALGGTDMIDIGEKSGAYTPCNGTRDEAAVLAAAGVPSTLTKNPSLEQIASALDEGKAVLVALDARPIWYGNPDDWPAKPLGHTIRFTGVDRADDGSVRGFYVNDSGTGMAGQYVPASTVQESLDEFGGGRMATSDDAVTTPISDEKPKDKAHEDAIA